MEPEPDPTTFHDKFQGHPAGHNVAGSDLELEILFVVNAIFILVSGGHTYVGELCTNSLDCCCYITLQEIMQKQATDDCYHSACSIKNLISL